MQIVIDQSDFQKLSSSTQRELLERLAGKTMPTAKRGKRSAELYWRRPVDLSPELTAKLVHGLAEPHRKRLALLAEKKGRATLKELLKVTGDQDWRSLSHFQTVITRRLRRLIEDPEKKAELVKWDFDSTVWSKDGTDLVDGAYYVSAATAKALRKVMVNKGAKRPKAEA